MKRLIRLQLLGFHSGKQPGREDPLTLMAQSIPSSLTFSTDQHPTFISLHAQSFHPFHIFYFIKRCSSGELLSLLFHTHVPPLSMPWGWPLWCCISWAHQTYGFWLVGPLWGTDRKSEGWRREARKCISPLPYLLAKPQFPLSTRQHQSGSPSPKAILLSGFQEQCPPLAPLILGW